MGDEGVHLQLQGCPKEVTVSLAMVACSSRLVATLVLWFGDSFLLDVASGCLLYVLLNSSLPRQRIFELGRASHSGAPAPDRKRRTKNPYSHAKLPGAEPALTPQCDGGHVILVSMEPASPIFEEQQSLVRRCRMDRHMAAFPNESGYHSAIPLDAALPGWET